MQYLTHKEYKRLIDVAKQHDMRYALAITVAYAHGLRVSELLRITHRHVVDGQIEIARLKGSRRTLQPVCEGLRAELVLAAKTPGKLFPWSRQWFDLLMKRYCGEAGIHPSKAHMHVLKHSCAMRIWEATKSLGAVQGWLGHKSASSSVVYLRENDSNAAAAAMSAVLD